MILPDESFIKTTGQYWKMIFSMSSMTVIGIVLIYQAWFSEEITIFTGDFIPFTLIAFLCFIWGCFSLTCPKYKLRILWYSISKLDHRAWTTWLFAFTECPMCNYNPSQENINHNMQPPSAFNQKFNLTGYTQVFHCLLRNAAG